MFPIQPVAIESANSCDRIAHDALAPARVLFGGRNFTVISPEASLSEPSTSTPRFLKVAIAIALLVPGIMVGLVALLISRRGEIIQVQRPESELQPPSAFKVVTEPAPATPLLPVRASRDTGNPLAITQEELAILTGPNWLNDEIINRSMQLLNDEFGEGNNCYLHNSFFYKNLVGKRGYSSVQRWSGSAGIRTIEQDKILIPINLNNTHWTLACINFKEKRFEYYDSFGVSNSTCLAALRAYVQQEAKAYHGIDNYDLSDWIDYYPGDIPRQKNDYDCGVFVIKYAEHLAEGLPMKFTEDDMPQFRKEIAEKITPVGGVPIPLDQEQAVVEVIGQGITEDPIVLD